MVFYKKMIKLGVGAFGHKSWLTLIIGWWWWYCREHLQQIFCRNLLLVELVEVFLWDDRVLIVDSKYFQNGDFDDIWTWGWPAVTGRFPCHSLDEESEWWLLWWLWWLCRLWWLWWWHWPASTSSLVTDRIVEPGWAFALCEPVQACRGDLGIFAFNRCHRNPPIIIIIITCVLKLTSAERFSSYW